MAKHIESIDILKGITILLVVIGHAVQGVVSSQHLTINTEYNSIFILKQIIYGFHMSLFFYNCLGIKDFLLSPIVPFSQYWFLYVLFFIHIIYYFAVNIKMINGKLLFFILGIILYVLNPFIEHIWILENLCRYIIFFSIGTYVFDFIDLKQYQCKKILIPIIVFLLVNGLYIKFLYMNNALLGYYFWFITSISGSLLCLLLSYYMLNKLKKTRDLFSFFGRKSMEIYCTHLLILAGIRIFLLKILKINELWSVVILSGFITILLCYIIFYKIDYEKTKLKWIFGIKNN